jgi:hypothetical protein
MYKVVAIKHIGKENCEHEFVNETQPITYHRICKLCGRLEVVEKISDFTYYCNLFHGKEKVK